jgi:serine/threonine protein phosphatase 1
MRESTSKDNNRIFAIGDIHGCYKKLETLFHRLPIDPERDFLIFMGDYINRGPESREVISYLLDIRRKTPNTVFLLGNHEYELLEYVRTGDPENLRILRPMGVEETLSSYGESSMRALRDLSFMPEAHKAFLNELQPYFRLNRYLFVHAGIVPGESPENCSLDRLLTVREVFLKYTEPLGATIVFGHTPFETPFVAPDKIGIDTGAVYGNLLTAVELPGLRFYHA